MDKIIIIGEECKDEPCELCGVVAELRPYGPGGKKICFDCGMKPENIKEAESRFYGVLSGKTLDVTPEQKN